MAQAREELNKALAIDPQYFPARIVNVRVLAREGKLTEAKENLELIQQDAGNRPDVIGMAGRLAVVMGDYDLAVDYLSLAMQSIPSSALAMDLARALWARNESDLAFDTLLRWLENHPEDVDARTYLAGTYLSTGDSKAASILSSRLRGIRLHFPTGWRNDDPASLWLGCG